jgi:predicted dehydrogenase
MGASGRLITSPFLRPAGERATLLMLGPHLVDLLEAALGRIVGVRAHGDPDGWVGLLLEHEGGRFSEASMCATTEGGIQQAVVEVFGSGGSAQVDCAVAGGPEAVTTMVTDFAAAVEAGRPLELDVRHALHLQQVIDNAETDLIADR